MAVDKLKGKVSRLKKIVCNQGFKTTFKEYVENTYKWAVETGQKPESSKGFVPQKNPGN